MTPTSFVAVAVGELTSVFRPAKYVTTASLSLLVPAYPGSVTVCHKALSDPVSPAAMFTPSVWVNVFRGVPAPQMSAHMVELSPLGEATATCENARRGVPGTVELYVGAVSGDRRVGPRGPVLPPCGAAGPSLARRPSRLGGRCPRRTPPASGPRRDGAPG